MPGKHVTPREPDGGVPELAGYGELLEELKSRIRTAQIRATVAVNRELVLLYWRIGREILERQAEMGWGAKVIDRLSADLRRAFPDASGYSSRNLKYMRTFAEAYPDEAFVQGVLAQITWYHNLTLLDKVKELREREWYVRQTIAHGWSRNVLVYQIESGLYRRQGQAVTNFDTTLPTPQSDLARELLKDPYHFGFLGLGDELREREIERSLLAHIRDFLLELGVGFALVGSQYHLEVGGQDYYLDLLFYHLRLRCFVVVELKVGAFQPEHAGKMNFYLAAVDDLLRHEGDQLSIGLILCRERNRVIVEYALHATQHPIGVAGYRFTERLPEQLQGSLPTAEELEREIGGAGRVDERLAVGKRWAIEKDEA